jgi:DNA-binding beta-propeller fold protein YncE
MRITRVLPSLPAAGALMALAAAACATSPSAAPPATAAGQVGASAAVTPADPPTRDYEVLVGAEAVDQIARVRFGPGGARVVNTFVVGLNPLEPDGPHGVAMSPDGRHVYVTTAHGAPFGYIWKLDPTTGRSLGRVTLGNFPATLQVSPDGIYAYVVNFNLHGEMEPSSVSIVSTDPFVEVARLQTCTMPHGSRFSADGRKHYSVCMMDDLLVEIDTRQVEVSRHFVLTRGKEHGMPGLPGSTINPHAGHDSSGHGMAAPPAGNTTCSPTWAHPSPDGTRVWVACNRTNDIVEIETSSWTMRRRIPAGEGIYNLASTHDGRLLVATNKRGQSVSVIDVASGRQLALIPTLRRVVHGVVVTEDDRYAFVTVEGIGSEPGTVEVIDLRALRRVASVDVGQMVGGIDLVR